MTRLRFLAVLVVLVGLFSCAAGEKPGGAVTGAPLLAEGEAIDLFKVSEAVWAREAKHGYAGLSEPERTFLCVWNLEAEVNNGGFSQFFLNSSGDHSMATPAALRQVGAPEMAALLEQAMKPFGPSGPASNRGQRSKAIEALPSSVREEWGRLDSAFYALSSPESGLRALVETNRGQFFAP